MMTNVLLTGSTGIIGREVLYELLYKMYVEDSAGRIVLLIRKSDKQLPEERLKQLLTSAYLPEYLNYIPLEWMLGKIDLIDTDLENIGDDGIEVIKKMQNLHVIHLASSTNLATTAEAEEEIYKVNYLSTLAFLNSIVKYISKFTYVGTAYSCGYKSGVISDDYLSLDTRNNRNPYEELKVQTGKEVIKICENNKVTWQILRPSIVCGRLLEAPYFYIPKFNVFYAFGNFFDIIGKSSRMNLPVRLLVNESSGLNIVSSDYVAKVIVRVFTDNGIEQLNIVNTRNVSNNFIVSALLKKSGIVEFCYVNQQPENLNVVEKMYYKSVGQQFTPYLNSPVYSFDTTTLREIMYDVPEPDIASSFEDLYNFALIHNFQEPVEIKYIEPVLC